MSAWRKQFEEDIKKAPEPYPEARRPFAPRNTSAIFVLVRYDGIREYTAKTSGNVIDMMTFTVKDIISSKQYTLWLPNWVAKQHIEALQSKIGFKISFIDGNTTLEEVE